MRNVASSRHSRMNRLPVVLRSLVRLGVRLRIVWIMLVAALFLSGCVKYDVGITIQDQTHGEIVQHIQLGERLTGFSGTVVQDWLRSIEQRSRRLGGRVKRLSKQELVVRIPFYNGADLEEKFNQFFQPVAESSKSADQELNPAELELPELDSHLAIRQSNFLLIERNTLRYDLDLRSLGVLSSNGNLLISPGSLLDLEFRLNTPWGARSLKDALNPEVRQQGRQLVWVLKPGELNHLEVVFWVPSPLGIGTVGIVVLVAIGVGLKSLLTPEAPTVQPTLSDG